MGEAFLGQGWTFPVRVNARGGLDWSSGAASIREAVWLILATPKRSRIMQPTFGCGIHDYVFAPNNPGTRAAIMDEVRQALVRWEPRIDVLRVTAASPPDTSNTLMLSVDYRVRANNAAQNIVYPFYLLEGLE
ncbi:baseplate protein [Paracoccus gahaiensis]|uniref:Baseplate protein n=1 Tax=Paracoccus gahaiensis TaxID=1706839 RepID=A0A4U0RA74_9RHOB|nr:GPW/gp25 family protein [Paracoccus gahaiensis]TJZ91302.1 baseplate protein [Paracoccus gahaiensis]